MHRGQTNLFIIRWWHIKWLWCTFVVRSTMCWINTDAVRRQILESLGLTFAFPTTDSSRRKKNMFTYKAGLLFVSPTSMNLYHFVVRAANASNDSCAHLFEMEESRTDLQPTLTRQCGFNIWKTQGKRHYTSHKMWKDLLWCTVQKL